MNAPTIVVPTLPPHRTPRARRTLFVLAVFLGIFEAVGLWTIARESWKLATYQPVTATVLGTDVEVDRTSGPSRSTTYRPRVRYRYRVGNATYTSDVVTPLDESRGGHWAYDISARYATAEVVTAYYDPGDPESAFLLRSRSWVPWTFVVLPPVMFWIAFVSERRRRVPSGSRLARTA